MRKPVQLKLLENSQNPLIFWEDNSSMFVNVSFVTAVGWKSSKLSFRRLSLQKLRCLGVTLTNGLASLVLLISQAWEWNLCGVVQKK